MTFDKLTKRNAKAFFELYMAGKDGAIKALKQLSAATGGPKENEFDYSKDMLPPLWDWAKNKIKKRDTPLIDVPYIWHKPLIANNPHCHDAMLSLETLGIVDGIGYYIGDVIIKHMPDMAWGIDPYKASMDYCTPAVLNEFVTAHPTPTVYFLCDLYLDQPDDIRCGPSALIKYVEDIQKDEEKYRALYQKNEGHSINYKKSTFD